MSKNIFEQSTQDRLSDVFNGMVTPSRTIVQESTEATETKLETPTYVTDEAPKVGSRFDAAFDSIFGNEVVKEEYTDEAPVEDEAPSESEMVSIPRALLDELYAYVEDTMGSEDETSVDDVDFELPEEGADIDYAKNKMTNTQEYGSPKQSNKTKPSSAKKGQAVDGNKARTGKPELLKNILACYVAKGSPKQACKTKVKDTPINK